MCKKYRVSVKYKSGPLAGKFVVQVVNVSYKIACELYDIWTLEGYEVLIIQMNCRKPNLQRNGFINQRKTGEDKMNYEMIQDNIDASTLAAIYAKTEEERRLHAGDVLYWKNKKEEYMNTHNVKGELLNV